MLTLQVSPPLDASDCVCAVSDLWWYQRVCADQRITDVGSTAGREMRKRLQEGLGMGVWKWVEEGSWTGMRKVQSVLLPCVRSYILAVAYIADNTLGVTVHNAGKCPEFHQLCDCR